MVVEGDVGEKLMARVEARERLRRESRRNPECGESQNELLNVARVEARLRM